MIGITRGIAVYIDQATGNWAMGTAGTLSLTQIPVTLWFTFEGTHLAKSGMVVNVSEIDEVLRSEINKQNIRKTAKDSAVELLDWAWQRMRHQFDDCKLSRLVVEVHDSLKLTRESKEPEMIQITTKYELAASHRLWNQNWDHKQNQQVFGKCSNPAGHGHNYSLEVTLSGTPDTETGQIADLEQVDQIVRRRIIERFDHKNLNEDSPEFAEQIPTVENMARVFWERLNGCFGQARLVCIRLWETPRTYAQYNG